MMIEEDRNFNTKYNNEYAYSIRDYYMNKFPMLILGLFNTIIRIFHPSHTHHFNSNLFKSTKILEENYKIIQKEALNVYKKNNTLNMKDIGKTFFDSIDEVPNKWKVYVIKWYDKIHENALINCPETSKIISKLDDVHVAMFSILEPGKKIIPHKGPSTGCLRYHLGLQIPSDKQNCYIEVNGEKFYWNEGKGLIFDDTYVHSVNNDTNEPRIILFVDIERPMIFPFNYINKGLINFSPFLDFVNNLNNTVEKNNTIEKEFFTV
jgi:beta-hydroxylase